MTDSTTEPKALWDWSEEARLAFMKAAQKTPNTFKVALGLNAAFLTEMPKLAPDIIRSWIEALERGGHLGDIILTSLSCRVVKEGQPSELLNSDAYQVAFTITPQFLQDILRVNRDQPFEKDAGPVEAEEANALRMLEAAKETGAQDGENSVEGTDIISTGPQLVKDDDDGA